MWNSKTKKILGSATIALVASVSYGQDFVPGEVLVGLKTDTKGSFNSSWNGGSFGVVTGRDSNLGLARVQVPAVFNMSAAIRRLKQDKNVAWAEPNYIVRNTGTISNDPLLARQWNLAQTGADTTFQDYVPKSSVVLAIIDSGVDMTHPDLSSRLFRRGGNPVAWNVLNQTGGAGDDFGHGTMCAGIADAQGNNSIGISGVAGASSAGSGVLIMPIKALTNKGSGTSTGIIAGIVWAVDNGATVISLSLGSPGRSSGVSSAVAYARSRGCIVVAAAGNYNSSAKFYPAADDGVISVGSTDPSDSLSSFSQFGPWVKVAAPGSNITSTAMGGKFSSGSGTSFAGPLVAGELAMLLAQSPGLSTANAEKFMLESTAPLRAVAGKTLGGGRVNIKSAFDKANLLGNGGLTGSTLSQSSLIGGQKSNLTVTFSGPLPGTGGKVNLYSTSTRIEFAKITNVTPGATSIVIPITAMARVNAGTFPIVAEMGGRRSVVWITLS